MAPFEWTHRGCAVSFPCQPYESQKKYTELVVDSIVGVQNALLESPTGTGKTLALLCGAIAWIRATRTNPALGGSGGGAGGRVIYASRTHSQLAQVVSQLKAATAKKRSREDGSDVLDPDARAQRVVRAVVIGSREQLCVNEFVREKAITSGEKIKMCNVLSKGKKCDFYNNFSATSSNNSESGPSIVDFEIGQGGSGGESAVCDIEDLVSRNRRARVCPYYKSRDLAGAADLVLMPYNYLLDPHIRGTLSVELKGAAVILDEAHNVTKTCEESASLSPELQDVAVAIHEADTAIKFLEKRLDGDLDVVGETAPADVEKEDLYLAKEMLGKLEAALVQRMGDGAIRVNQTYPGDKMCEVLSAAGLGIDSSPWYCSIFQQVSDVLSAINSIAGSSRESGRGVATVSNLLKLVYADARDAASAAENMRSYYRLYVTPCPKKKDNFVFNMWCFHPGFSMRSLINTGIRSLILTSGTLKPMATFRQELGIDFHITFSGPHIIRDEQVICKTLSNGPDSVALLSTYQNRTNDKYLRSLGIAVLDIIGAIPSGGALVFFPSYAVMDATLEFWRNSGIWDKMLRVKCCFVEPRYKDAFNVMIAEYRRAVDAKSQSGSVMFAVCRGKVAEGIDFSDEMARAVLVTGIPFPNLYDPKVKLKKEYVDSRMSKDKTFFSGSDWYKLEAYRAVNQAIGRVIRHKRDFGAVVFLDRRFATPAASKELSDWIKNDYASSANFAESISSIRGFFGSSVTTQLSALAASSKEPRPALRPMSASAAAAAKRKKAAEPLKANAANPPKKIVIAKRKGDGGEGGEGKVADYRAVNIVVRLKKKLEKPEMSEFKCAIKNYKDEEKTEELFAYLRRMYLAGKLDMSEVADLKQFLKPEHKNKFDLFLADLAI